MKQGLRAGIIGILASFILLLPAYAATFSDVSESSSYYEEVEYVSQLGIIQGYPEGTFKPNNMVTRGQISAMICRMLGEDDNLPVNGNIFSDVPASHWANGYITKAVSLGIINGFQDGTFRSPHTVTYNQALAMLIRAFGLRQEAENAGGYPQGYWNVANQYGLLEGVSTKGPSNTGIRRYEIAVIMYNYFQDNAHSYVPIGTENGSPSDAYESKDAFTWITESGTYWGSNTSDGNLHFRKDYSMGYWNELEMSTSHFSLNENHITLKLPSLDTDDVISVTYSIDCFVSGGEKMIRLKYIEGDSNVTHLGGLERLISGVYTQKELDSRKEDMLNDLYERSFGDKGTPNTGGALDNEKMLSDREIYEYLVAHYRKGTADGSGDEITVWEGSSNGTYSYETQVRCAVPGNPFGSQPLYWITVDKTTNTVTEENAITGKVSYFNLLKA